ncbi:hypothetical protein Tco_0389773 [Tanacetum coccineum]
MSSAKAEYVAVARCCANVLWMKSQLTEYGIIYEKVPIFCDNTSAIAISNNPVLHSRTKHIDIRYHFIRDHVLKGDIKLYFIPTQYQLADIFTKPMDEPSFKILIIELVVGKMHKEAQQAAGGPTSLGATSEEGAHPQLSSTNEESRADEISKKIKLEDLSDLLKDIRSAFFTLDSPQDEPIIVSDESKEEEEASKDKDTHVSSYDSQKDELEQQKAKPKAKVTSLKASLTSQVAELKNIQWELPAELQALPVLVSSVQKQLKTLDSLPSLLNKVTKTMNRFATVVENASGATTKDVPSAGQATASPAKGEKNNKDAETNLQNELVDLLGIDVVEQYHKKKLLFDKYYDKMLKRRKSLKIINCDVITQKGHTSLKVYREDETIEVIANLKTRMEYLDQTEEELKIDFNKPLKEQDPLNELNELANKKIKRTSDLKDHPSCGGLHVADSEFMKVAVFGVHAVTEYEIGFKMLLFNPLAYVVPTGRVKVPAGRYVVPTGKDNVIVSTGRLKVIPASRTILVLVLTLVDNDVDLGMNGGVSNSADKGTNNVSSSNTPIGEKIDKIEQKICEGKLWFVDDDGNPLVPTSIVESDSEVEVVFDETTNLRISTSGKDRSDKGYGLINFRLTQIKYRSGNMEIHHVDIDECHMKYNFTKNAIKLDGNATLDIVFKISGNIERDHGNFRMTTTLSDQYPIVSFSKTSYSVLSEYGREILAVKFESKYATYLPPEKLQLFKEALTEGYSRFQLDILFEWSVKRERYYVLSPPHMNLRYSCRIPHKAMHQRTRCIIV